MRRKKIVLQCPCGFMRTGLEKLIRDTDLSASLDIVESTDSLAGCQGILNALPVVHLVILTIDKRNYNLISLLQLVGECLPKIHPDSKIILIGDIANVNPIKFYFNGLKNVNVILDKTITLDELRRELLSISTNKEQGFERVSAMLTPRELEVLRMLLDGGTPKQIADDLQLNFRTVSHHKRAALAKLGVRSLCPLVDLINKKAYNKGFSPLAKGQVNM